MEKTAISERKTYDFFISYYQATGLPYARHLRKHAEELNRKAFLDKEDIRADIREDSDEFRLQVDRAIANSKNFILVMTLGFKDRPEVKREWTVASKLGITRLLFKKDTLDNQDLLVQIDEDKIDFSSLPYTSFHSECDLLEEVENRLRGKSIDKKNVII